MARQAVLRFNRSPDVVVELAGDVVLDDFARRVGEAPVRVSGRLVKSLQEADRIVFVITGSRSERVEPS